jgi:tRNA A37 threonylcarbamoyladenosine dehydratase
MKSRKIFSTEFVTTPAPGGQTGQKGTKIMKKYAIVIDGKTVDRITAEDAESAAYEYSEKMGLDSDFGFVLASKILEMLSQQHTKERI